MRRVTQSCISASVFGQRKYLRKSYAKASVTHYLFLKVDELEGYAYEDSYFLRQMLENFLLT
jgi:hypothetical protein